MLVLALDTTTRAGSVALADDTTLLEVVAGDAARTHATRLPGDLVACLARHGRTLTDVDLFAVAAGPGSFTGLRIGIATMQGLAFANRRPMVAVSALEALGRAALEDNAAARPLLVGAWMDAQRHEVYAELFRAVGTAAPGANSQVVEALPELEIVEAAAVADAASVLEAWQPALRGSGDLPVLLVGDGALGYRAEAEQGLPGMRMVEPVPLLAPAIADIARRRAQAGLVVLPHQVRPLYVRRPDAELARERRQQKAADLVRNRPAEPLPHGTRDE